MSKPLHIQLAGQAAPQVAGELFASFVFDPRCEDDTEAKRFAVPLAQLTHQGAVEQWHYPGAVQNERIDGVLCTTCADYLMVSMSADADALGQVRVASKALYSKLMVLVQNSAYPHILKTWNYIPGINLGDGDSECYKQFVVGRGEAIDNSGRGGIPPAATAVGSEPGLPLRVHLLAAKEAPSWVENPRQVSAFEYPREHGPRSPSFSRAARLNFPGANQILVSGTASIVGHQSQHGGDALAQAQETVENLQALIQCAAPQSKISGGSFRLYLKDPALLPQIQPMLNRIPAQDGELLVLKADVCRQELLVEVDGVVTLVG